MNKNKRDYLIRTFSRTKRKDYENYILNRIWTKLDRLDIKPVTQQYVKRADGKYALIDLFFPQINLGIEVDEAYHLGNVLNDEVRTYEIGKLFQAVKEKEIIIERIDASQEVDGIHNRVDELVRLINDLASRNNITTWEEIEDYTNTAKSNGVISIKDNFTFDRTVDIISCFGREYNGFRQGSLNLNNEYSLWFPHLSYDLGDGKFSDRNGWMNLINSDWTEITEKHVDENNELNMKFYIRNRITFMKIKDPVFKTNKYQFVGIFKPTVNGNYAIYKRISDEVDLKPYLNPKQQV
ncbi:AbaSI family restriction endonuclease [Niallia sp. FSL M8-0099]|uniref:AbaSI family restriction endonuclease n=1 Tax=Niallia sp. FSL M8-0099 TaxID=2954519 RepID=UPI0030F7A73D